MASCSLLFTIVVGLGGGSQNAADAQPRRDVVIHSRGVARADVCCRHTRTSGLLGLPSRLAASLRCVSREVHGLAGLFARRKKRSRADCQSHPHPDVEAPLPSSSSEEQSPGAVSFDADQGEVKPLVFPPPPLPAEPTTLPAEPTRLRLESEPPNPPPRNELPRKIKAEAKPTPPRPEVRNNKLRENEARNDAARSRETGEEPLSNRKASGPAARAARAAPSGGHPIRSDIATAGIKWRIGGGQQQDDATGHLPPHVPLRMRLGRGETTLRILPDPMQSSSQDIASR